MSNPNPNAQLSLLTPMDWVVPERVLLPSPHVPKLQGATPGKYNEVQLAVLRDFLQDQQKKQEPRDYKTDLAQMKVRFENKQMIANFGGLDYLVTDSASWQLSQKVLPARFFRGLKVLADLDPEGALRATQAWEKFREHKAPSIDLIRTVNMFLNGRVHRVIRSAHTTSYATYSNLGFVLDLLEGVGDLAELHLVDVVLTDNVFRLRFIVMNESDALYQVAGMDPLMQRPYQMVEVWNSETGHRRTAMKAGLWRPICTNSVCHWSDKTEYSWVHRGKMNSQKIKEGVRFALPQLMASADAVIARYQAAKLEFLPEVASGSAIAAWLTDAIGDDVSQEFLAKCLLAEAHESTTPGATLASAIDCITFAARDYKPLQQEEYEQIAAKLLHKGV